MGTKYIITFDYLRGLFIGVLWIICFICSAQPSFAYKFTTENASNSIQADSTQFNITGKVVDETGRPLPGATVFISNSKWAVATSGDGVFKLSGLPTGSYEILARMMGYETFTRNIAITNRSISLNISLKPDAIALSEAKIVAKPDPNRARYLRIFTEMFIGQSSNAQKSKIINSDVIRFRNDKATDILTARSTDFIKIENLALGYNVFYLLNSFYYDQRNRSFAYEGKIYFEELKADEKMQKEWSKNRVSAYYGSMQHFFRSLYAGTTATEGFNFYKIADSDLGRAPIFKITTSTRTNSTNITRTMVDRSNLKPVKPDSLVKTVNMAKFFNLPLLVKDGDTTRYYICYAREPEPSRFLNSPAHLNLPVKKGQVSGIYQWNDQIILNKNGTLNPPKSIIVEGFWGWRRIGDVLPEEYYPNADAAPPAEEKAEFLAEANNVEKIHLQMDRPWYLTGDTAWMKLYVVDAYNKPATGSKLCFIELIDAKKRIVKNLRLPLQNGIGWGELPLSDSLIKKGAYVLRLYTNNTPKTGSGFLYKTIRIADIGPTSAKITGSAAVQNKPFTPDSLKIQIFPEGGNMIAGVNSRMAIRISASGRPVNKMTGYIENEDKSHVAIFETNEMGVGFFNFKPLQKSKYRVALNLPDSKEKRFTLPQADAAGINMAVKQTDDNLIVYLNAVNVNNQTPLNLVVKSRSKAIYRVEKVLTVTDSIVISKTELPEGLLQFCLYADGNTLGERMVYNKSDGELNIKLTTNKTAYKTHDKVEIDIDVTDFNKRPVSGNFSVSVNNIADVTGTNNQKNIIDDLLLGEELKDVKGILNSDMGKLKANATNQPDDLLLTINAQNQSALLPQPSPNLPQDTSFTLTGQALTAKGKPAPASVVGLVFPSGGPVLTAISDGSGKFAFNGVPGKRGDPFYIVAKDKNKDLVVALDKYEPPVITDAMMADTAMSDGVDAYTAIAKRIEELSKSNILGKELTEVRITEKKKAEPTVNDIVKERSSNIGGRPDQVVTFLDLLGCNNATLGECLVLKLISVKMVVSPTGDIRFWLRGDRGSAPMAVFVDGIERPDALRNLATSIVASVEVLRGANASAYGMRSGNGVIVITTKAGGIDYNTYEQEYYAPGSTKTSPVKLYKFENGFDTPQNFYTPDYSKISGNGIDKWRPTIYWNPNVTTGTDGKAQLSYFTNNAPGTYQITIEGIDNYGRIGRQVFTYTVSN